jgi:molybdopterin/thiamine biosynthesis adenylyltransferase
MTNLNDALSRTVLLIQRDLFPTVATEQIVEHLAGRRVRLSADERNLTAPAGQTALVTTAIALAQTGARISLDVPDIPLSGPQPPLPPPSGLATGLRAWGASLLQPFDLDDDEPVDLTVVLGDTPSSAGAAIRLSGSAWEGRVSVDSAAVPGWEGYIPFGAMLAAQAGAAEAFRSTMASLAHRHGVQPLPEHHVGPPCAVHLAVEPVKLGDRIHLGAVDVVSAGAITNAAIASLLRVPGVSGVLRVMDGDIGAVSNLNRYELLNALLLDRPKVDVLADFQTDMLTIEPLPVRLTHETGPSQLADCVLVGVDDIPSRWLAQERCSGWLCVAGTSRMEIVISEHAPGSPCAGCMHPHDDEGDALIPTVSFVSKLAGVLQAHRLLSHAAHGAVLAPVIAYGLGLQSSRPLLALGQAPRADCPIGCAASQALSR